MHFDSMITKKGCVDLSNKIQALNYSTLLGQLCKVMVELPLVNVYYTKRLVIVECILYMHECVSCIYQHLIM